MNEKFKETQAGIALKAKIVAWRQTKRSKNEKMPESLWGEVIAQTRLFSAQNIGHFLRIKTSVLTQRASQINGAQATSHGFIELPSPSTQSGEKMTVTLRGNQGQTATIASSMSTAADWANVFRGWFTACASVQESVQS